MFNKLFKKKETPEQRDQRMQAKRSKARAKGNRSFPVHTDGQTMQEALDKEGERIEQDEQKMDSLKEAFLFLGSSDEEPKKKSKSSKKRDLSDM
jgi:hypothetical protein